MTWTDRTQMADRWFETPGTRFPVTTVVRDALYDRIPLAEPELAIIGLPSFLRLERIQQLGFVSRIWPGAKHARYEHSIGVFHLARLAVAHLRAIPDGAWITGEDARTLCAAALLHDIGHYPFSHAVEELGAPIEPHERVGRRLIEGPEVAPVLKEMWGVDPGRVAAVIDPGDVALPPADRTLRAILSGPLDVDKLDYLPRDAQACNVPYGGVDTSRLIESLGCEAMESGERRIVVGAKGVSPLHSLINARQEMFDNVYWHHTNRACMAMLLRAIQDAMAAGVVRSDEITGHDDASLLAYLARPEMPLTTRRLTAALAERRVHKRALEVSSRATELYGRLGNLYFDPAARRETELAMCRRAAGIAGHDVPPESILIDIPKPETWRTDVWVRYETPPVGFRRLMPWREVVGLAELDFKRYEEHRRLIRIVAAEPVRELVRMHWETIVLPLIGGAF